MTVSGMTTEGYKRILITGSRDWDDYFKVASEIVRAMQDLTPIQPGQWDYNDGRYVIVHGACPPRKRIVNDTAELIGADYFADQWALGSMYPTERHPADWSRYLNAAGPIRNRKMVELGADICLAFIKNNSRGASGCAQLAEEAGILTRRFAA